MNKLIQLKDSEGNNIYPKTVDNKSEWHEAVLANNVTAYANKYGGYAGIRYKKEGNRVYIEGSISVTPGSSTIILTTLPEEYFPKGNIYVLIPCGGTRIARIFIGITGNLYLEWCVNISDGSKITSGSPWFELNMTYSID